MDVGEVYGRLTVVELLPAIDTHSRARVDCECGNETIVERSSLTSGRTSSCGCLGRERRQAAATTHGHTRGGRLSPEYQAWAGAKARTTDPNHPSWRHYGGRGIRMHPSWLDDFPAFLDHIGLRPSGRHSIDRIDVDGNYEPGNVRWATQSEQMLNVRPRSPGHSNALSAASVNAAKTHCPNGHPFSGRNLIIRARGGRDCRACSLARSAAYRARRAQSNVQQEA